MQIGDDKDTRQRSTPHKKVHQQAKKGQAQERDLNQLGHGLVVFGHSTPTKPGIRE
jgi:hypothetical protein